jgi:hypothetical protein
VLALAHDPESRFLEGANCLKMIDARDLGQGSDGHFDFAYFFAA